MSSSPEISPYNMRYLPAVLRRNAAMGWIVEYYVLKPDTNEMMRKRIRLNVLRKHYRTIAEFKVAANGIVADINARLAGGWTPFGESENARYYTLLSDVLTAYLKEKGQELKKETMRSYSSFANIFGRWCEQNVPNCKCVYFNRVLAVRYMDDYYNKHSNHPRSYNNQLKMARAFFGWAKEKCYVKENPFELIRTKREQEKKRILIPANERAGIREYFKENCPTMMIVCELVYTSLIRPIEIARLKVDMLHIDEHYIAMPANITKNAHARNAPLSESLCTMLRTYIDGAKGCDYLIGSNWKPATKPINSHTFTLQWLTMRERIHLPKEMQLYSLRDTGIFDKLKSGIDPLTVMQAADHHDLAMTTRYGNHIDPNLINIIYKNAPEF